MVFLLESFFSGCISKVVNDGVDFSKPKIKSVINDKRNQNFSTKIYRVIEKALNIVTDKKFKDTDELYDAMERIFNEFRDNGDTLESVRCGLRMLGSDVSDQRCENFLEKFYNELCQDNDLYKRNSLILQQKGIKINQQEFYQLNETVESGFAELNRKVNKIDEKIRISYKNEDEYNLQNRESVKSRTQEYADIWNKNMFLNNFDKRDENAGVNIKLSDVFLDEHLPHYIWCDNKNERSDLKDLFSEYIGENRDNRMLLVLGQPGIGKSTLITWLAANFYNYSDKILVYKFAYDLKNIDWHSGDFLVAEIIKTLDISYDSLDGKLLILDGFDEISTRGSRVEILNYLFQKMIKENNVSKFSVIITCRENYIENLESIRFKYITLKTWDEKQIKSFCKIFQKKAKNNVSENTIMKLVENNAILGVPLILYMIVALNISVEKEGSIVDVYDKIFTIDGGIYDRCINNKNFAEPHRISNLKKQIHQISRDIAIRIFENNPVGSYISKEEYHIICSNVIQKFDRKEEDIQADFLIGNYFTSVKHCEGIDTEQLYFVHRSIYEYFVVEAMYSSIENAMIKLTDESQEELAEKIVNYLKQGIISNTIGEYLQYKLLKFYNSFCNEKGDKFYLWWEGTVEKLISNGMFYYTQKNGQQYKNILDKEILCFLNLIKILRLVLKTSKREYILKSVDKVQLEKYIRFTLTQCRMERRVGMEILNLSKIFLEGVNLSGADIKMADLKRANLKGVDLSDTDLSGADLSGVDFREVNLENANLFGANLTGANLTSTNLSWTNLNDTIFDENQVDYLRDKYRLDESKVSIFKENKIISYENYCNRLRDIK